jgi:hypothetical protein
MTEQAIALQDDENLLTVEQLKSVMPNRQKKNITPQLVDELNRVASDINYREFFRESMLCYADVLTDPHSTMDGYISAVKYVSFKSMGNTNEKAWKKTFPDRYQKFLEDGRESGYIRSVVSAYNRGQMVQQMLRQAMIPIWLLNQDKVQDAINVQATLMVSAKSEKVRSDAANSLLTHLKQPEATTLKLDVAVKQDESIGELRQAMIELAIKQRDAIADGILTTKDLGESKLVDGECERIE